MIRINIKLPFFMFVILNTSFICTKKILLTGGAGFIGSHVAQKLLERGDSVIIVDNMNDAYSLKIKKNNLSAVKKSDLYSNLKIYYVDICNKKEMELIFSSELPDVICHLAARAGVRLSIKDPYEYFRTNNIGTLTIFELARQFNVRHVVSASSSSVYGERREGFFSEDDSCDKQLSQYGATKKAGELLSYVYHYLYNISVTNLRFFTVYGPRGRMDMAPFIFMDAIHNDKVITVYGDGTSIRDFTYVDDIVDGVLKSIDTPCGYQILNLGRGTPIILSDFISTMETVVKKRANINYAQNFAGDVPLTHANIAKAQSLIHYNPLTSIDIGLARMYEWYINEYLLLNQHNRSGFTAGLNSCICCV